MSDYNNPNSYDKYGNPLPPNRVGYEPVDSAGRGPFVLLGLLVLIGIVGGAMYFTPHKRAADVATAPPAASDTIRTAPAPMATPATTQQ